MIKYLVDTNVVSEILRQTPNQKVHARYTEYIKEIALPAVGWHEMWYGVQKLVPSQRRTLVQDYLEQTLSPSVPILAYDARAAEWHAAERARLSKIGRTPPYADGQIAAIAFVNGLVLVTLNIADYKYFKDLEIQDWSK
ncbi:MAG: type II toxin-antitoxin system VapC family toxin [Anaerolineae bacterium]|nr:type II toxin-antitoxin system VapC family toxin [Anaerolineae bacterium]